MEHPLLEPFRAYNTVNVPPRPKAVFSFLVYLKIIVPPAS